MASHRHPWNPNKGRARPGERFPENPIGSVCGVSGKIRWPSRRGARAQARKLRALGGTRAAELHSYRCRGCGNWHIGHRVDPSANGPPNEVG